MPCVSYSALGWAYSVSKPVFLFSLSKGRSRRPVRNWAVLLMAVCIRMEVWLNGKQWFVGSSDQLALLMTI